MLPSRAFVWEIPPVGFRLKQWVNSNSTLVCTHVEVSLEWLHFRIWSITNLRQIDLCRKKRKLKKNKNKLTTTRNKRVFSSLTQKMLESDSLSPKTCCIAFEFQSRTDLLLLSSFNFPLASRNVIPAWNITLKGQFICSFSETQENHRLRNGEASSLTLLSVFSLYWQLPMALRESLREKACEANLCSDQFRCGVFKLDLHSKAD